MVNNVRSGSLNFFGGKESGRSSFGQFLIIFGLGTIAGRLLALVSIVVSTFASFGLEGSFASDQIKLQGFILGAILGAGLGFAYGLTQAIVLQNYRYRWVDLWFAGSTLIGLVLGGVLGIFYCELLVGEDWDSWVFTRANLWAVISWAIGSMFVYREAKVLAKSELSDSDS